MNRKAAMIFGALTAMFSAQFANAQVLADKIPGDAVAYIGWAGADVMKAKSSGTHLEAILAESRIGELFGTYLDQVEAVVVKQEPRAAEPFRLVRLLGAPLWKYPTAVYVGQLDATDKKEPHYTVALLTQAGDKADAMVKDLTNLLPPPKQGMPKITVSAASGLVSVIVSSDATSLDVSKGALATSSTFTNNLKQVKGDAVMSMFVDMQSIIGTIESGVEANGKEFAPKVKAFLDESGFRGLKQVVATAGFEGKDWVEESFIAIDKDRKGLLKTCPSGPFDMSILKGVPATASVVGTFRFDPAALTSELRNTLAKTDDTALQYYNYGFGALQQALGVNVETTILAPLGTDWVAYGAPEVGSGGTLGMVLVNKLDDPAAMKKGLSTFSFNLMRWSNIAISKAKLGIPLSVKGARIKIGDAEINYLAAPIFAPSWAIDDGKLYLGLYPQTVGSAIRQAHSGKPSILESEKFAAALKLLKHDKLDGFGFYDLPTSARHGAMYDNFLMMTRYLGAADLFVAPIPEPLLPPIDTILDNIAPAASGTWTDDAGTHTRSVQSFPGATALHGDSSALNAMMGNIAQSSAVLLPSLNRARETADRVKSSSNLRQIGQAMMLYANEHKGELPDHMGELVAAVGLSAEAFDSPRNGPLPIPQLADADLAAYLSENGDYIYTGKNKLLTRLNAEVVLAYENPEGVEDGINILFADGHVEFYMMADAMRLITQQKTPGI